LNFTKTLNTASIASGHNTASLTDAALTTIIRKPTSSCSSRHETHQRVNTDSSKLTSPMGKNFNYFLMQKHRLSRDKLRLKSRTNTEENSRINGSGGDTGYIQDIQDERFNRRVCLKEEEGSASEEEKEYNAIDESMHHLRDVRSRDYSQSTTRSNLQKMNQPTSSLMSSGLPSNAVIQETLRKQYNNSRISRKDYSKRTRVSVLDSSLSSLYKNSPRYDPHNSETQNHDPNLKPFSQPVHKFKKIDSFKAKKNLMAQQFMEFSPCFTKRENALLDSSAKEGHKRSPKFSPSDY
jgi:hypothetical protein